MKLLKPINLSLVLLLLMLQPLAAEPIRLSSIVSATKASSTPKWKPRTALGGFVAFADVWGPVDLIGDQDEKKLFSTVSFNLEMFNKLGIMAEHVGDGNTRTDWSPLTSAEATVLTRALATERGRARRASSTLTDSYK